MRSGRHIGSSLATAAALILGITLMTGTGVAQGARPMTWPVAAATHRFLPPGAYNWRGAATHALITTVWYPAAATTKMVAQVIGPPNAPLFTLGEWEPDGAPAAGRFPLIVLSHGTGGSAQIIGWLARGLASRGYVVAAVNHPGNNALEEYTAEGFLVWWERARDLSTVIDFVLRDPMLRSVIDRHRIGAIGFSLGGYTMFEIAGARTDPERFQQYCRSAEAEGCVDPPEFPNLFARWAELQKTSASFEAATNRAGESYRDARVRAAFAIAPALGPALIPDSLRRISIPIHILSGDADQIVPIRANAQRLAQLTRGASLTLLPGAAHYTFLATCSDVGRRAQPQLCADAADIDRDSIHQRTIELAAEFFERNLK
jgi:predicted dienelactone hydrolase